MNVILIISDSLRTDFLSCYGNDWIYTPYLERLARDAIVFDRAYIGSFATVPCRNDILTGRWTFTYKGWAPLGHDEVVLPEVLNEAGYLTALFVDTPHPFSPGYNYQRGFQAWEVIRGQEFDPWKTAPVDIELPCDPGKLRGGARGATYQYLQNVARRRSEEDYFPARTMRAAASWLEENYRRPFFLYVDTFDPHEPWDPPAHYLSRYEPEPYEGEEVIYPRYDRWASFMTDEELAHCRNLYAGEVSLVDRWVGYLLARVEDLGLLDETAIVFASDHGHYLGEHGYIGKGIYRGTWQHVPFYPELCHIPLMVRLPHGRGAGRTGAIAQPVDFMPTILDLLGVSIPDAVQGKSLLPVLEGQEMHRQFAVSSPSEPHLPVPHPATRATITTEEWALIFGPQQVEAPPERPVLQGPVKPELYHLPSDPGCVNDVLADQRDVARRLQGLLVEFLGETGLRRDHLPYYDSVPSQMRG